MCPPFNEASNEVVCISQSGANLANLDIISLFQGERECVPVHALPEVSNFYAMAFR